uniref:Solute carrier organic anion transporter family member 6A1 n=1 Tax=Saimiri boliviensis boliviensis TaxID=39432 RepID=A0A2K6T892_SAIBB
MHEGVPRRSEGRDAALGRVESWVARARPAKDLKARESSKSSKSRKPRPYLKLFPRALIRFGGFRKSKKVQPPDSGEADDSWEQPCGVGCVASPCCECCKNIRCFMVFHCILVICQGVIFGLIDVSIGDFQRQYYVKTIENLALQFSYDISSALVVIFVAFYGDRKKVTCFVVSSFLVGFGSLLCAFPSFTEKGYQSKAAIEGIAECSEIIGYALGYVIGAPLVKVHEHSTAAENTTNNDVPDWKLTWWISFLYAAIVAWCIFIPLSCFPNNMPGSTQIKAEKRKRLHLFDEKHKDLELGISIKDLFAGLWILMKNPVLICLALSKAAESLVLIGASEFLPKYLENQFILTPNMATALAGILLLPGGALGHLLGGVIVSTLQMSYKALMRFTIVTSVVSLILLTFIIAVRCNPVQFAGISEDYDGTGQLGNLTAPCNQNCSCSSSIYSSICGRDDVEYFSPCFAGCMYSKTLNQKKTYYNCSCIKEGLTTEDGEGDFIDARPGKCDAKCYKLPLFVAFIFSTLVFSSFCSVPILLGIMQVVPETLRSLALGVSYVILRIFGTIPGPFIFKISGESSCIFRDTNDCGHRGQCWIYNQTKMAYLLVGICFVCKLCTLIFTTIAFLIYKHRVKDSIDIPDIESENPEVKKRKTDL